MEVSSGTNQGHLGAASQGNRFVAVGGGSGTWVILVSANGTTWTKVGSDAQVPLPDVAYGQGTPLAVGFANTVLFPPPSP